jgi:hypothetical protein
LAATGFPAESLAGFHPAKSKKNGSATAGMPLTGTTRDREQCCQQHSTPDRSTRVNEDEERQPANNRRAGSDPDGDRAPTRLSVSIRMGCHQLWAFLGAITELDEPYYSQVNTSSLERSVCFPFPVGGPSKLGFGLMGERWRTQQMRLTYPN